ncbi:MAG: hypothetical protein ACRD1I_07955, partial [Terriglobia bacterium]
MLAMCWVLAWSVCTLNLTAQTQPFSSSAEYQSMLAELHHKPVRPSRMSAGTLLERPSPPVSVEATETAADLRLETASWRLEIRKNPWQLALTNTQTSLTWQLKDRGGASAGVTWIRDADDHTKAATLRLTQIQRVERRGNTWQMQVKIGGSTETATLTLTVISPTVIRLSIRAPQLGD